MKQEVAQIVAKVLIDAGHTETYYVGGCVRDDVMGLQESKDYDLATSASPDEVEKLFDKVQPAGRIYGVSLVILTDVLVAGDRYVFDVGSFRTEAGYTDGRRPDHCIFTHDVKEDAKRRDFTINALYKHPITGQILDFFGGVSDITKGIIRTVGDPAERFKEDKLRMMRAIRFASRFGFEVEQSALDHIREHSSELGSIAVERVSAEFLQSLSAYGIDLMSRCGILQQVLSGYSPSLKGKDLAGRLHFQGADPITCLAGLIYDANLEEGEHDNYLFVAETAIHLRLSTDDTEKLWRTIRQARELLSWDSLDTHSQLRLMRKRYTRDGIVLIRGLSGIDKFTYLTKEYSRLSSKIHEPLFLNGHDLADMGIAPGPVYGEIFAELRKVQDENGVVSKEQAVIFAERYANDKTIGEVHQ